MMRRMFIGIALLGLLLAGCGTGGRDSVEARLEGTFGEVVQSVPPSDSPKVRVTVRTDYALAHKEIRFLQVGGDPDFLPQITLINQGFEFWFDLPKGYAYRITFNDIPSIDEPAPWEFTLPVTHPDTLVSPEFTFKIHP